MLWWYFNCVKKKQYFFSFEIKIAYICFFCKLWSLFVYKLMKIKYENAETTSNRKGQDYLSIWQYEMTNVNKYFGIHLWIWFKGRTW